MTGQPFPHDLIGREFGLLTVIEFTGRDNDGLVQYLCCCSCRGENVVTLRKYLLQGRKKSCGCLRVNDPLELIDQTFGLLVVREFVGRDDDGVSLYRCVCTCADAGVKVTSRKRLINGSVTSCGCLIRNKPKGCATRYLTPEAKRQKDLADQEKTPYKIIIHRPVPMEDRPDRRRSQ